MLGLCGEEMRSRRLLHLCGLDRHDAPPRLAACAHMAAGHRHSWRRQRPPSRHSIAARPRPHASLPSATTPSSPPPTASSRPHGAKRSRVLDFATAKALREDQRKFLSDIDDGFDAELWGKQEAPEGKELRAQVAQLRRGGDYDALAALEAQLRERIAFLRNLTPAASFTGLWKNHDFGVFGRGRRQRPLPHDLRQQQFRLGKISVPLHRRLRRVGRCLTRGSPRRAHNTDVDENTQARCS